MAGKGPAAKPVRRRRNTPARGSWKPAIGVGWQHSPFPVPPDGLLESSRLAWDTWLRAWFAANWTPADLPGLRQVVRMYDQVERGEFQRSSELRLLMDTYGITPKGQQDRRWMPPRVEEPAVAPVEPEVQPTPYAHLGLVKNA